MLSGKAIINKRVALLRSNGFNFIILPSMFNNYAYPIKKSSNLIINNMKIRFVFFNRSFLKLESWVSDFLKSLI
jgi:hypothetical protein